jgi:hypothetical protein
MKKREKARIQLKQKLMEYYPDSKVANDSLQLLGYALPRKVRKVDKEEEKRRI